MNAFATTPEERIEHKRRLERTRQAVERVRHAGALLEIAMDEATLATTRFLHAWEEGEAAERYRTAKAFELL